MGDIYTPEGSLVCTECGRSFYILCKTNWAYKVTSRRKNKNKDGRNHATYYQCSFTCYDHACLRSVIDSGMDSKTKEEKIAQCEEIMRAQGKNILHKRS